MSRQLQTPSGENKGTGKVSSTWIVQIFHLGWNHFNLELQKFAIGAWNLKKNPMKSASPGQKSFLLYLWSVPSCLHSFSVALNCCLCCSQRHGLAVYHCKIIILQFARVKEGKRDRQSPKKWMKYFFAF